MMTEQRLGKSAKTTALVIACLAMSILLLMVIYWIAGYALTIDFTSYYLTIQSVWQGKDPYHGLSANYISLKPILSRNLNAPITLWLGTPLQWLSYPLAYVFFVAVSFISGIFAAKISAHYFFQSPFSRRERRFAVLIFCAAYPILLNLVTGQLGAILFCLIMVGYHGYQHKHDKLTAITWALAISTKFFVGLLLIFCLQQKRYRLASYIVVCGVILSMLPLVFFGPDLYDKYVLLLSSINWYDGSWNASLIGFLSRIIGCITDLSVATQFIRIIWIVLTVLLSYLYFNSQTLQQQPNQSFAVCLVLMLFLSPLGWIYYFPLLMPALLLCYQNAVGKTSKELVWLLSIILVSFPIGHLRELSMPGCIYRLSLYSLQTYGLMLLIWQTIQVSHPINPSTPVRHSLFWPLYCVLWFGVVFLVAITYAKIH